ncbi:MAG: Wzz/FepE/Etk N-terminal domain-containing protein [Lachnospiraceae bacterium]
MRGFIEMGNEYQEDDGIEIDLRELLFALRKRWWMILAAFVIGAGSVGAYSMFITVPQYRSQSTMYILTKETTLTSLADLQIGAQLTQDYKILITSRPVLQGVIKHLNLDTNYKQLRNKITVENPKDTRILSLTVQDSDPYVAKAIVDDIAITAADYIGEIMEMVPPKIIEDGEVAQTKSSPSVSKNAAIGGLLGVILLCGLITFGVVMNDTIKSEEDINKYLNLPVLAVLPKKKENKEKKEGKVNG